MARRVLSRALQVWSNGARMGEWRIAARGTTEFVYDPSWVASGEAWPLSLSLPLEFEGRLLSGPQVGFYFDNLLPDNDAIRRRLRERFHARSDEAFDLLEAIGRDCVGAVQLLQDLEPPRNIFGIDAEPLDEAGIERLLVATVTDNPFGRAGVDEVEGPRISIAGAQEKTALTSHAGRWCLPRGATPTTHIFKLPLGLVGNRGVDMSSSVENEWLCAQLLAAYGVPVAACEIGRFGTQKALIVERFDRHLHASGNYWLRLPQEDFCQATGTPASAKYESEGGPGLLDIARILQGSAARDSDLATLMRAQLLFWMLAAIDGHAKNFSLRLEAQGRYRLTPLYDVLSAWPAEGRGPAQWDRHRMKLALALRGKNKHYHLQQIERRHFNQTARRCGMGADMEGIIAEVIERTPAVIEQVGAALPADFPGRVFDAVTRGMRLMAERLAAMPAV